VDDLLRNQWTTCSGFCNLRDVFPPEEVETFTATVQEVLETQQTLSIEYKLTIGERPLWFETSITPMTEDDTLWVARDVTDRKQAEDALRDSEVRFRTLFEQAAVGVALIETKTGQIVRINQKYCDFLNYTMEDMLQRTLQDVTYPEDRSANIEQNSRLLEGRVLEFSLEKRYVRKDGHVVWGNLTVSPLWKPGEKPDIYNHIAVVKDITDQKRAEDALLEAGERLVRNVTKLEQRNHEISLLNKMVASFQASLTVDEVHIIAEQFCTQLFPEEAGALFRVNPARETSETVVVWGFSSTQNIPTEFLPEDCPVLQNGQNHLAETGHPSHCHHSVNGHTTAHLCIPLIAHGETIGVMSLQNEDNSELHMSPAKQQLARNVADTTALTLANLNMREALRQQAIRDPLTGLFNRRYLEETLDREVQRAKRNHQLMGIIMIDIDYFKTINDTYGHDAGDAALRELGGFLLTQVRREDIACRFGGEEFVLILPGATLLTTRTRAELLQDGLRQLRIQHNGQQLEGITLSLGVAMYPDHGTTGMAVVHSADVALYRAKQAGRNRVVVAN
jgi:diguanylate cyclase (GGDEF)-like protein/PAS domain S-box-containing protein